MSVHLTATEDAAPDMAAVQKNPEDKAAWRRIALARLRKEMTMLRYAGYKECDQAFVSLKETIRCVSEDVQNEKRPRRKAA